MRRRRKERRKRRGEEEKDGGEEEWEGVGRRAKEREKTRKRKQEISTCNNPHYTCTQYMHSLQLRYHICVANGTLWISS